MNNADWFWDRFESIAWAINENSACVDYIDNYAPYDLRITTDYHEYDDRHDPRKDIVLSEWCETTP